MPGYKKLRKERDLCVIPNVSFSENGDKARLQDSLNHMIERLSLFVPAIQNRGNDKERLHFTWAAGMDGSSGFSLYRQKCETPKTIKDEKSMTIFGIQLLDVKRGGEIVWFNTTPGLGGPSAPLCSKMRTKHGRRPSTG